MSIPAKTGTDVRKLHLPHQMLGLCGLGCLVIIARQHGLHLSTSQLIHDNGLTGKELSVPDLLKCARSAGLKARSLHLKWSALTAIKKALPAIVVLKHGRSMVLLRVDCENDQASVVLRDPNGSGDALLVIDRVRFENAWTGEVVLIKRNYEISDESQPFARDIITDFHSGQDKIDLSGIDANTTKKGDQAFRFIGAQNFDGNAGELRYQTFDQPGTANDITVVSGDLNGDRVADFEIELTGIVKPTSGDFVL